MLSLHRRSRLAVVVALATGSVVCGPGLAGAAQPTTTRASLSSSAAQGNDASRGGVASADGRWVAFVSLASNLVAGDTNGNGDVFLRDRQTGQTKLVSVGPGGVPSDGGSDQPVITPDGRWVVFRSNATTLVAGSSGLQLFAYDRVAQTVARVPGPPAPYVSPFDPSVSDDGSRVAYRANAAQFDVFVADLRAGTVRRVSETALGVPGNGGSSEPDLSGDGRWVGFRTSATNLAPDTNSFDDVVVRDLDTSVVTSISSAGGVQENAGSLSPSLSRDGCVVAFQSSATNLVQADAGTPPKIFVRDRCTGNTEVASVSNAGTAGIGQAPVDVSEDGCRVVFLATTIVSPVPAAGPAAVLRDRCTGTTSRQDLASAGDPGPGDVTGIGISGGTGRYVTFTTVSAGLVGDDTNGQLDVFVRDLAANTPPVAALTVSMSGGVLTADATGSSDPDGFVLTGSLAYGDGSPAQTGLRGTHAYARGGTYGVTATVTDADGVSATRTVAVTVPDPNAVVPPGGGAPPGGDPPPGGRATSPLVLDRVALSRARWAVVAKGKRADARHGSVLTLRLSAPGTVTLRFQRARPGRRVKGRCVAGARRGARCTRYTDAGQLARKLPAGTSTIALSGRLGTKVLTPGAHRLTVTARAADGRSARPRTLTLTVVRVVRRAR